MTSQSFLRTSVGALHRARRLSVRPYSTSRPEAGKSPRHFLSIADVTQEELVALVRRAYAHKTAQGSGLISTAGSPLGPLAGKTVAMMFNKRSTRTRVSTEGAVVKLGGHPFFLGKDDIQLGVNESLYDTARIISSMTSCIVARVGPHSDVADLAKDSDVPVINALSADYHPMQTVADFLTIFEAVQTTSQNVNKSWNQNLDLGLERRKIAWVGDASNVLYDLAIGATKLGVDVAVATPSGYEMPSHIKEVIKQAGKGVGGAGSLTETNVPEEAVKGADFIVTDTWISMGQEEETAKRLKAFAGFQVTSELAERGGAKKDWKFMHCLPRHKEEVTDDVFYSPRSLVFQEGENRLWAAISVLESFVVNEGKIISK